MTFLIKSFTLFFILKYISKLNLEHSKKLVVVVHAFQKTQKLIVKEMYRDLFIAYMHSHCAQKRDKRGCTRRVSHCSAQGFLCHCSTRECEKLYCVTSSFDTLPRGRHLASRPTLPRTLAQNVLKLLRFPARKSSLR